MSRKNPENTDIQKALGNQTGQLTGYPRIMSLIHGSGIVYSLLRDLDLSDPRLDELDLLVFPESRDKFIELMAQEGFVLRKTLPKKAVYAAYRDRKLLLLDVHFAFIQDGWEYMSLEGVAERLQSTPQGYNALSREDQLLHYFFHNLIGKKHLQEKHLPLVQMLLAYPLDKAYLQSKLISPRILNIFQDFCDNPPQYSENREYAKKRTETLLAEFKRHNVPYYERKKQHQRQAGVQFAFLGVDGAGKSTTIEYVQRILAEAGKLKVHFVYMGPWGYVQSPLLRLIYKLKFFPHHEDWGAEMRKKWRGESVRHSYPVIVLKWLANQVKGTVYYLAVYQEMWYRHLKSVRPFLKRGYIVLCDRYVYDLRYIYKKRPIRQFRFLRWAVCKFFPKPDKVVFVWNDPDQIIARKPQLNKSEIIQFQEFYRKVLRDVPTLAMQSNRSPMDVADDVVQEIMKMYLQPDRSSD